MNCNENGLCKNHAHTKKRDLLRWPNIERDELNCNENGLGKNHAHAKTRDLLRWPDISWGGK